MKKWNKERFATIWEKLESMIALRSLRARIFLLTLVIGLVPCIAMRHGIVSNYYAPGLFDLLFQYYDRDLGRNLEQNTPERMKMLLYMLCQREKIEDEADDSSQRAAGGTSKAYRLRKHTLAALTAFPEVNIPRLIRYVEMIDAAFWYQQLLEKGTSQLTECFRKWA